jgi:hypothetical protein
MVGLGILIFPEKNEPSGVIPLTLRLEKYGCSANFGVLERVLEFSPLPLGEGQGVRAVAFEH